MHNKILINTGFYLLLLFALATTVFPRASYFLALAIFIIWLVDALIFRDLELSEQPLFFPIISFNIFLIVCWFLTWLFGVEFDLAYIGLLSMFYFVVPGFVITGEQRRMILWTFIAGAMLIASLNLISWWSTMPNFEAMFMPLSAPASFFVTLAFCIVAAFYAESLRLKDKLFYFLISIPLVLVIVFSGDKSAVLVMLFTLITVGIFIDRTVILPAALAIVVFFSGILDIRYLVERNINFKEYGRFVQSPADEVADNIETIEQSGFYGTRLTGSSPSEEPDTGDNSFFLKLFKNAGPPAIILFFWMLLERARESYFKRRRVTTPHARAYHLTSMLFIGAIIIGNLYGSVFDFPSIILAFWLIAGISEV